jgi:hypothetical protein
MLECLREAEALAVERRQSALPGLAFMTVTHSLLGKLDDALVTRSRALEIAGRLGDLRLRILATSYLVQANYLRSQYDRVIELATGNLLPLAGVATHLNGTKMRSYSGTLRTHGEAAPWTRLRHSRSM